MSAHNCICIVCMQTSAMYAGACLPFHKLVCGLYPSPYFQALPSVRSNLQTVNCMCLFRALCYFRRFCRQLCGCFGAILLILRESILQRNAAYRDVDVRRWRVTSTVFTYLHTSTTQSTIHSVSACIMRTHICKYIHTRTHACVQKHLLSYVV